MAEETMQDAALTLTPHGMIIMLYQTQAPAHQPQHAPAQAA